MPPRPPREKVLQFVRGLPPTDSPPVVATSELEESATPAPPLVEANPGWFARACQHLGVTNPDDGLAFSHSPNDVKVKLSSGAEYCIHKASL